MKFIFFFISKEGELEKTTAGVAWRGITGENIQNLLKRKTGALRSIVSVQTKKLFLQTFS